MGYIISKPRNLPRVTPGVCGACGQQPWVCPSDGDYQCACIAPWLSKAKGPGRLIRVHYDRAGQPYGPQFIDGYVEAPEEDDESLEAIIRGDD